MTIRLSGYDAAVFIASTKFGDEKVKENKRIFEEYIKPFIKTPTSDGKGFRVKLNPAYEKIDKEEQRVKHWKKENEKREFIINYLKENCPDKDYSEKYANSNKWNKDLMYPTEESKKCEYLHEDGRHCTMKREGTSCYTCCFVCFTPEMCKHTNCPLLPDDRKPSKK